MTASSQLQSKNFFLGNMYKEKHRQNKKIFTHYGKVKLESSIRIRVDLTFINALVVISDGLDNMKPNVNLQSKNVFSEICTRKKKKLAKKQKYSPTTER